MEWMLQVVDEIDDAIGAARHVLGLNAGVAGLLPRIGTVMRFLSRPLANH